METKTSPTPVAVSKEDEWGGSTCEVCGWGTLYGSRHHTCGTYALRMERRIASLEAQVVRLQRYADRLEWIVIGEFPLADEMIEDERRDADLQPGDLDPAKGESS